MIYMGELLLAFSFPFCLGFPPAPFNPTLAEVLQACR
jgi:hypothetical protein